MIDDVASWGRVSDPVGRFLCQAAFYVVPHPAPPTNAEVAAAREKDRGAKVRFPQNLASQSIFYVEGEAKVMNGHWASSKKSSKIARVVKGNRLMHT